MHSGDMLELEQASLTEQEKEALLQVMERAKEFDKQVTQACLEGQLHKWTNPLKGWQPRWFSVDHQQGVLHYYMSEDKKRQAPRGSLHLWGAVVAPSEEDSQSFTVNGANGEIYKLRGQDAKERQFWVSRLRRDVEYWTNKSFTREAVDADTSLSAHSITPTKTISKRTYSRMRHSSNKPVQKSDTSKAEQDQTSLPGGDAMLEVLRRLQIFQDSLYMQLQTCCTEAGLSPTDKEVLLLRATSEAAVTSVKDCLALMKQISASQSPVDSPQHNVSLDQQGSQQTLTEKESQPQDKSDIDKL